MVRKLFIGQKGVNNGRNLRQLRGCLIPPLRFSKSQKKLLLSPWNLLNAPVTVSRKCLIIVILSSSPSFTSFTYFRELRSIKSRLDFPMEKQQCLLFTVRGLPNYWHLPTNLLDSLFCPYSLDHTFFWLYFIWKETPTKASFYEISKTFKKTFL